MAVEGAASVSDLKANLAEYREQIKQVGFLQGLGITQKDVLIHAKLQTFHPIHISAGPGSSSR